MNTDELAALEERWLNKQRSLAGDRDGLYEQTGVYEAWREIFRHYVVLAKQGDLEALKRAVYFAWAQCSISRLTTGIKDLDSQATREAFGVADELTQDGRLDAELQWMLPYYYVVERSYLDRFEDLEALKQASGLHPFLYRRRCLDVSFAQRGQMGDYWRAEQALLRRWSSVDMVPLLP
jgi:hypothetical protein